MTAPVPTQVQSTQGSGTTIAPTCNVGDLLVVIQEGTASGSGSPVAPSSGGSGSWSSGPDTSGTDVYANAGTNNGRVQVWSKVATSGDSGANITVSTTGFTAHRFQVWVVPGTWDSGRLRDHQSSTANTGSTPFTLTDLSVPAIVFATVGYNATTNTGLTLTWDGATSGNKFQRAPYVDEGTDTTSTPDHTGSHYGAGNSARSQSDYQEYDSSDTLTSVLFNNGMANTTHAVGIVVYGQSQLVTANYLNAAPTVYQATVRNDLRVDANFLNAAPTIYNATVTGGAVSVFANYLNAAPTIYQPTVTNTLLTVQANYLNAAPTIHQPTVGMTWSDEAPMVDPGANERVRQIAITAAFNYPDDAGDLRIALKQNGSFVETFAYFALTDTPTEHIFTLASPATGTGFSIWWEARTFTQLDPLVQSPALITDSLVTANFLNAAPTLHGPDVILVVPGEVHGTFTNLGPTIYQASVRVDQVVRTNYLNAAPTIFLASGPIAQIVFTPPALDREPATSPEAPPIYNRLARFYPTVTQGRAVWQLLDGSYTFAQPHPTYTPEMVRGNTGDDNTMRATYLRVFLGGHSYVVNDDDAADLSAFLVAEGLDPDDWLVSGSPV